MLGHQVHELLMEVKRVHLNGSLKKTNANDTTTECVFLDELGTGMKAELLFY